MLVRSTEKISFFQELGRHLHQKCCNYLTYDFAEPDTVIMKEGIFILIMIGFNLLQAMMAAIFL